MPARKPIDLKIGYNVKLGREIYEIIGEERLIYSHPLSANIASGAAAATLDLDNLKPADDWLYWILGIASKGKCGWQVQYPKGVPRGGPIADAIQLIPPELSRPSAPYTVSLWIKPKTTPPSIYYQNESGKTTYCEFVFYGWKFKVRKRTDAPSNYTEVADYLTMGS